MTTGAFFEASEARYLDRELSWLDFNGRVLAQAEDPTVPLLERVKFLSIFARNLDEFFMIRVGGLADRLAAGLGAAASGGLPPREQLRSIRAAVLHLVQRQSGVAVHELFPSLAEAGISVCSWESLADDDLVRLGHLFEREIFPVLTPLAVDPGHPFPYISGLSLNLAVLVSEPGGGDPRFARVKVPPSLPRLVRLPAADGAALRFVLLEQVIAAHLPLLFPGMDIISHHPFRVTRNADIAVADGDADDLLAAAETEVRRRRFGQPVRLEVDASMTSDALELILREVEVSNDALYVVRGPLDLAALMELLAIDRPDLSDEPWTPVPPAPLGQSDDLFATLRRSPVLVHHPYDSFPASVEAFIDGASRDPDVLAVKLTLYRTSGDSPIAAALIRAAEAGKQVAVLIELTARFDEEANIAWARRLERAGVHVVYGLAGLKTHSKMALVVRSESDGIRRYVHVGTGNYNSETARIYEDVGLLSADPDLGADIADLFNLLTGYARRRDFRKILMAPHGLRERLVDLIAETAAAPGGGRIVMKMNSLVDETMIEALYAASAQGCSVDLIVRGICRLRPETPGLSDHIRVRSIIGRFLEHSRIYAFGPANASSPMRYFIGSADLMPRNLDRRVELVAPVDDAALAARVGEILAVNLADTASAWRLRPDGRWRKVEPGAGVGTHQTLQELAVKRSG